MGGEAHQRWEARPLLGAALHAGLVAIPLILGIGVGLAARDLLPGRWSFGIPPWAVAGLIGMVVVWLVEPLTRRLIPLSWLLKLTMLFPGRAPTRFKVARQAGRLEELEKRLASAVHDPDEQTAQRSAELILSLVTALTAHDRRTRGHAERTRVFTDLLSEEMGLAQEDRDRLRWAALLHDIGKLEVSRRLLNKPGRPTTREWEQLRRHPEDGDRLVAPLRDWLGEWADTVLHHHERWDGGGYPAGLAGEQIALGARIVAVADVYDVMTAVRSYKRPSSAAAAREELVACSGSQFDPAVVRAFLSIPLPRLRWALGPLAWVAQLPVVRETAHTGAGVQIGAQQVAAAAPGAVGAAAAATGLMVASKVTPPPPPTIVVDGASAEEGQTATTQVRVGTGELDVHAARGPDQVSEAIEDVLARLADRDATVAAPDSVGPEPSEADDAVGEPDGEASSERAAEPSVPHPPAERTSDTAADRAAPRLRTSSGPSVRSSGGGSSDGSGGSSGGDSSGGGGDDRGRDRERRPDPPAADETDDRQPPPATATSPTSKEECFDGGWEDLGFRNQGQCVRFVQTGEDSRDAG